MKLANLWTGHLSSLALFALRSQPYLVLLDTAAALIRKALDRDNIAESFKILGVMGQQAGDAINQHRGDDIGVGYFGHFSDRPENRGILQKSLKIYFIVEQLICKQMVDAR